MGKELETEAGRFVVPASETCSFCHLPVPDDWTYCPHCGRPQRFPNVIIAERSEERTALMKRYEAAIAAAEARDCRSITEGFQSAVAMSQAVFTCPATKLLPVATSNIDVYATFHQLESLRLKTPSTPGRIDWMTARPKAEIDLLGSEKQIHNLHYANLSIDGEGLSQYGGECTVTLREDMIEHRASIFQENTGVFFYNNPGKAPPGLRSNWQDRDKLAVSKLVDLISANTKEEDFPNLLVHAGTSGIDDEFVEVQVFGPMTFFTFERIVVTSGTGCAASGRARGEGAAYRSAIRDMCDRYNVSYVEK